MFKIVYAGICAIPGVDSPGREHRVPSAPAAGASLLHRTLPPPSLPYCLRDPWPRNSYCSCTEEIHPESHSQQNLDQDAKTLLAAFKGRDGQAPIQEFLQQPERQHDNTSIQGPRNKKTSTPYSRRNRL